MKMPWNKKAKLTDYEEVIKEFNFDMNFIKTTEQYNNINEAYIKIREYYDEKNNNKELDIKIEKIRVERNLGIHPNDIISFGLAYFIAIVGSVFYFLFQLIINSFDKYKTTTKTGSTLLFLGLMIFSASYYIGREIKKGKPRNLMLNISLKVLEDIEKEEAKKLDLQQKIEQYKNANNEVAATSNIIIDNDQNDKEAKSNGKYIKGFINIIIQKRINK